MLPKDSVPSGLDLQPTLMRLGSLEVFRVIEPFIQRLALEEVLGPDSPLIELLLQGVHDQVRTL